jgi:hypothetical protein
MPTIMTHHGTAMTTIKPVLVAAAVLCLSACASTDPAPSYNDSLSTEITTNGTKFFTYIRHIPKDARGDGRGGESKADASLQLAVEKELETTGYCRDGFLMLERYRANGIARIRGECRDGASDSDRSKFPNRQ